MQRGECMGQVNLGEREKGKDGDGCEEVEVASEKLEEVERAERRGGEHRESDGESKKVGEEWKLG